MLFKPLIGFSDFQKMVRDEFRPGLREDDYKIFCGNFARQYRDALHPRKGDGRIIWPDWIAKLEGKVDKSQWVEIRAGFTENVLGTLAPEDRLPGAAIIHAFAIHYRMHMFASDAERDFADAIDTEVFKQPLRNKGIELFERVHLNEIEAVTRNNIPDICHLDDFSFTQGSSGEEFEPLFDLVFGYLDTEAQGFKLILGVTEAMCEVSALNCMIIKKYDESNGTREWVRRWPKHDKWRLIGPPDQHGFIGGRPIGDHYLCKLGDQGGSNLQVDISVTAKKIHFAVDIYSYPEEVKTLQDSDTDKQKRDLINGLLAAFVGKRLIEDVDEIELSNLSFGW